jgi:hypothetical protein
MLKFTFAGATCLLMLAACDPGTPAEPATVADMTGDEALPPLPTASSCDSIAKLAAAFDEPEPFASLRTGNFRLGDRALVDKFTTDVTPAGARCEMGTLDGFGPEPGKMYVVNCSLFSSGLLDREENAIRAKAVFDAAKLDLDRCLPDVWTSRNGSSNNAEADEAMIYETRADAERAMTASFYVYPIEMRKAWSDGGTMGQMAGWQVTLNFQKEIPAAPAAAAPQ